MVTQTHKRTNARPHAHTFRYARTHPPPHPPCTHRRTQKFVQIHTYKYTWMLMIDADISSNNDTIMIMKITKYIIKIKMIWLWVKIILTIMPEEVTKVMEVVILKKKVDGLTNNKITWYNNVPCVENQNVDINNDNHYTITIIIKQDMKNYNYNKNNKKTKETKKKNKNDKKDNNNNNKKTKIINKIKLTITTLTIITLATLITRIITQPLKYPQTPCNCKCNKKHVEACYSTERTHQRCQDVKRDHYSSTFFIPFRPLFLSLH